MTITIQLDPPDMAALSEYEAKMILAGELYKRGRLSLGQAAQLVGISKRSFIETIGNFGYSVFGEDEDELLNDIRNA
jgi:predicted HTH domain antitoxin